MADDQFEEDRMGEFWEHAMYSANVNEKSEESEDDEFEDVFNQKEVILPKPKIQSSSLQQSQNQDKTPSSSSLNPGNMVNKPLERENAGGEEEKREEVKKEAPNKKIDLKTRGLRAEAKLQQAEMKSIKEVKENAPDILMDDNIEFISNEEWDRISKETILKNNNAKERQENQKLQALENTHVLALPEPEFAQFAQVKLEDSPQFGFPIVDNAVPEEIKIEPQMYMARNVSKPKKEKNCFDSLFSCFMSKKKNNYKN